MLTRSVRLLTLIALLWAWHPPGLTEAPPLEARLTEAQALRELRLLERALHDLHPGLLRYQTEAALASEFAAARQTVAGGADALTLYRLATRLAASVRCGHTWTNPLNQRADLQARLARLAALPLKFRVLQTRLVVTASLDPKVQRFDEILAIDGVAMPDLIASWLPYLRADGSSDGKRLIQLGSDDGGQLDRLLPLLNPPQDGHYRLRLRGPDGAVREQGVRALPVGERDAAFSAAGVAAPSDAWQFEVKGATAVMTLPTFAFWNSDFDWKDFLQESFDALERREVARLIIDLRRNEGGDSAIGRALLGYLIAHPYTPPAPRIESAYERVPYVLARYLDTWDFSFFDRTGAVVRGEGRNWLLQPQPEPETVEPGSPRFRGEVRVLIGPQMSSAGFLLARDLKATGAATLIGETTGGNRRGLNGGQLAWLTLPHSGVAVDIPLIAAVYPGEPDAGITPHIEVPMHLERFLEGVDPVMERALQP